jgi:Uncharacterized conserved protein
MPNHIDHIETTYLLRASHDRVWHAISDAKRFGTWFGAEFDGPFAAAARLTGRIVPTRADAGIGRAQKPYLGTTFEFSIDSVEPMRRFSFRWHPLATDQAADYPGEPTTLVAFELEEAAGGTRLTITESGIDQIPPARRGTAAAAAEQPWTEQAISRCLWRPGEIAFLVEKFLAGAVDLRPQNPSPHQ